MIYENNSFCTVNFINFVELYFLLAVETGKQTIKHNLCIILCVVFFLQPRGRVSTPALRSDRLLAYSWKSSKVLRSCIVFNLSSARVSRSSCSFLSFYRVLKYNILCSSSGLPNVLTPKACPTTNQSIPTDRISEHTFFFHNSKHFYVCFSLYPAAYPFRTPSAPHLKSFFQPRLLLSRLTSIVCCNAPYKCIKK